MPLRPWTAALVMLLSAAAAQAAEPRILFAPRRALNAGEVVTVEWKGVPAEADEFEFLLRTDDGAIVRLTHQLLPSSGSFAWTVPNLPSSEARLQLRAGFDGVERVLTASEPFAIRGETRSANVEFRDGEWWSFEETTTSSDPPSIQSAGYTILPEAFMRPREWLLQVETGFADARRLDARALSPSRVDTRCGAPLVVPQRK
ncbi:MAG TPA: hypothetical protein VEK57_17135 [Thermoanaerobaculia bacterium]|nr:hypothetical protein [Thermoanaerobaculia bacterium]